MTDAMRELVEAAEGLCAAIERHRWLIGLGRWLETQGYVPRVRGALKRVRTGRRALAAVEKEEGHD